MRPSLAALAICVGGSVFAQDASVPGAPPPGALACSGCHGAGSDVALGGLSADEIESAMLAFQDGTRDATLMDRLATGFDDTEIARIAEWIAAEEGQE